MQNINDAKSSPSVSCLQDTDRIYTFVLHIHLKISNLPSPPYHICDSPVNLCTQSSENPTLTNHHKNRQIIPGPSSEAVRFFSAGVNGGSAYLIRVKRQYPVYATILTRVKF